MDFTGEMLFLQLLYLPGKTPVFVSDACNAELLTDLQRYILLGSLINVFTPLHSQDSC